MSFLRTLKIIFYHFTETAFEEALRKYIIDHESLKKRHAECSRYIENYEGEIRRLKNENRNVRQQLTLTENKLGKYEREYKYHQNQVKSFFPAFI